MLSRLYGKIQGSIPRHVNYLKLNKGIHNFIKLFKFNRKAIRKLHPVPLAFSLHICCENDAVWVLN